MPAPLRFPAPLALLTFVTIAFGHRATADDASRPNILLVTADDLGMQLGCYGDDTVPTPHLDALAEQSLRFTTAYVTQASCSSSRSSMLTGLYPHANGQYGLANAPQPFVMNAAAQAQILPNLLRDAGYRTACLGKLHVNPRGAFAWDLFDKTGFGTRDVRQQVGMAEDFVAAADENGQPWFLMFNLFDPHVAKKRTKGKDGNVRSGPSYFPDVVQGLPADPVTAADVQAWPWQNVIDAKQRDRIAGYYNCVARIDAAIGLLVEALDLDGAAEANTLVMVIGDHGPPFFRGKTTCYEAGLRIPMLVRWPGDDATPAIGPGVSDALASTLDLYATAVDVAGIDPPETMHGRTLAEHAADDWRTELVGEHHWHGPGKYVPRRAIRDARYKLIHNLKAGQAKGYAGVDGDAIYQRLGTLDVPDRTHAAFDRAVDPPEWELYDLQADPIEFDNRADDASLAEVRSRLQASLEEWQRETNDPLTDGPQPLEGADKIKPKKAAAR